jgi:hypothetical protein
MVVAEDIRQARSKRRRRKLLPQRVGGLNRGSMARGAVLGGIGDEIEIAPNDHLGPTARAMLGEKRTESRDKLLLSRRIARGEIDIGEINSVISPRKTHTNKAAGVGGKGEMLRLRGKRQELYGFGGQEGATKKNRNPRAVRTRRSKRVERLIKFEEGPEGPLFTKSGGGEIRLRDTGLLH